MVLDTGNLNNVRACHADVCDEHRDQLQVATASTGGDCRDSKTQGGESQSPGNEYGE